MIILGLGSNCGDRINNLRRAYKQLCANKNIIVQQVSPLYLSNALLPDQAPATWNRSFLNCAIRCESNISPQKLLAEIKSIETLLGRPDEHERWAPRVIDIDILAEDNKIIDTELLHIPHTALCARPFALWPLIDVAPEWVLPAGEFKHKSAAEVAEKWGSRFTAEAPFNTKQIAQRIETAQLVGILNATPDSFSDGEKFFSADAACEQALALVQAGAEVIDLGAESTAPNASPIDAKTEWSRLLPILEILKSKASEFLITPKISIDTRHAETAERAIHFGVDWINDVTGLDNARMQRLIAAAKIDCVAMHSLTIPASRQVVLPRDRYASDMIYAWASTKLLSLTQSGIDLDKIIIDPGIGFGKTPEQSIALLQHIKIFQRLGVRILVGHSRKSFMSHFTDKSAAERDIETFAASLFLSRHFVDYLRVHNVDMCARGLKVANTLENVSIR